MMTLRRLLPLVLAAGLSAVAFAAPAQAGPGSGPDGGPAAAGTSTFIRNENSGKCLQPKSPLYPNSVVVQRTCGPWGGMNWSVQYVGGGYYWIVNTYSGLCLDLQANSEAEVVRGTLVQQFTCRAEYTGEQWQLVPSSTPGYYHLRNRIKGLCADVRNRSTANDAVIQVIECKDWESAQRFRLVL
jgi:alpha-L-fucosidase